MARERSGVDKGSDTRAPHPFLFYFFSCLFSSLEGLEPAHPSVRSPAPPAPLLESRASPPSAPGSPPLASRAPGAGPSQRTAPTSGDPAQPRASLLGVPGLARRRHTEVDTPVVECKDQEPPQLGDSKERPQDDEGREEEAGWGPARSQVSSPSVATSSANRQLMILEGKAGPYFSSLDSSIDILKKRAQELIENINESRQKDHALMTNFRDSLKIKVSDLTEKLEERMYQIYNHHNKIIQEKLQEFTQKMAKIIHLETELKHVCHTVETVYKDLCIQPEV